MMIDGFIRWWAAAAALMLGAGATPATGVAALGTDIANPARCEALSELNFSPEVGAPTRLRARFVKDSSALPAHCEVRARIEPSTEVHLRLPLSGSPPRLLVGGCWMLCGSIDPTTTDDALVRGYATAQTDMGHQGSGIEFAHDPEKLEDHSWRATHRMTLLAKAVIAAAYGSGPRRSYFRGCSTGGRQGITEALLFPHAFDGIIVGAPAIQMAAPHGVWAYRANTAADGSPILDARAVGLLHEAALSACDLDDGARDNIISHPQKCGFRPAQLLCRSGQTVDCLTPLQVDAARKIYEGIVTPEGRKLTSIGFASGSELGWVEPLIGSAGQPPLNQWLFEAYRDRYRDLTNVPTRIQDFDFDKFRVRLTKVDAIPGFGEMPMRLTGFADAGGKMLVYAGWADTALPPATALDFVGGQAAAMGGANRLKEFLRFYMLPGVGHCGGGNGADSIDYLTIMEEWVEQGTAPDTLTAYKLKSERRAGTAHFPLDPKSIAFSRQIKQYVDMGESKRSGYADREPNGR